MPQCEKCLRLIVPTAPSLLQNAILSSLEMTATGTPPAAFAIWMAWEPSPPAPPQTSTTSPAPTVCGGQLISMRYAVAPTSMYAAAASQDRCGGFGRHWCACTRVNCAKLPQLLSYP